MDLPLCSRLRFFRIAALSAICLIGSSGLVRAEEGGQPPEKAEPVLKYDPEFPDSMIVATVNSEPITVRDVLGPYFELVIKSRYPAEQFVESRRRFIADVLPDRIERKLRVQEVLSELTAEQRKECEELLEKWWEGYVAQLCKEQSVSTMDELADKMKADGVELTDVQRGWREGCIAYQFERKHAPADYEPTIRELHEYYDQHAVDWEIPTRVKWQQIVVRRRDGEERASAQRRANEILQRLKAGGDFSELAREHTDGPRKAEGGVWDWMECDALACREIGELLASGDVGSISEVISYGGGFHIVKILDREDAGRKSFETVEPEIRDILKRTIPESRLEEAMQALRKKANIKTVFDTRAAEPSLFDGTGPKTFVYRTGHSEVVVRVQVTEGSSEPPARPLGDDPVEKSARISTKSPFDEALKGLGPNSIFPESREDEEEEP